MVADMFHVGHLNLIKRAKALGDYLIVGVHSDDDTGRYKRRPIIPQKDRYEMVRSCRYVDEVIESAPLTITRAFIDNNNIHFVVHGDDITDELKRQHKVPIEMKIVKYVKYTEGISTTDIIKRIKHGF